MADAIRVGTSGWIYAHWRGRFYPPRRSPTKRWLAHLAERLSTVEVNGTFYSLTRPAACEAWRAAVPEGFVFAVKGSRYITHMLKLRGFRTPLANFFASGILRLGLLARPDPLAASPAAPVRPRSGPTSSSPPCPEDVRGAERWARRHDARTTGRSALTGAGRARPAAALRPRSAPRRAGSRTRRWRSCPRRDVALVAADTAGRHPRSLRRTSRRLAYVRLHGARRLYEGAYTAGELRLWAGHCAETGRARARKSSSTSTTTATRRRFATRWSCSRSWVEARRAWRKPRRRARSGPGSLRLTSIFGERGGPATL